MRLGHVQIDMNNESNSSLLKRWTQKLAPRVRAVLVAGAVAAGASGLAWILPSQAKDAPATVSPVALQINDQPVARDGRAVTSLAPVVKKVTPSVVKVFVTTKAKNIPSMDFPSMEDPFLRRFFGDELGRGGNRRNMQT